MSSASPPPPGLRVPLSFPLSLAPGLSRESNAVVGKPLYSARVPRSLEQGWCGQSCRGRSPESVWGRSTALLLGWLETAHRTRSLGLHLKVHFRPEQGRQPHPGQRVEPGDRLLLLDLVSEALDLQALHLDDSPRFFLRVQSHGRRDARQVLTGHCRGQSRTSMGLLWDCCKAWLKAAPPPFPLQALPPHTLTEQLPGGGPLTSASGAEAHSVSSLRPSSHPRATFFLGLSLGDAGVSEGPQLIPLPDLPSSPLSTEVLGLHASSAPTLRLPLSPHTQELSFQRNVCLFLTEFRPHLPGFTYQRGSSEIYFLFCPVRPTVNFSCHLVGTLGTRNASTRCPRQPAQPKPEITQQPRVLMAH